MKRNVLHLIGSFEIGGTERQAIQLARLLAYDGGYRVFIACLDSNGVLADAAYEISAEAVPEYRLTSFYDVNFWTQIRRCMAFLQKHEIEIIHTHDFYTNVFGMLAGFLAGVPVRIASKRNTFSKTRNQMLVERQAFRAADVIVVNAEAVRTVLVEKGVPGRKIVTVYNGVDLTVHTTRRRDSREHILRDLGLDTTSGKRIITIVANLRSKVKNHEMFLRAAKRVRSEIPDVAFVIAGEGELLGSLKERAKQLGIADDVHFIGRCGKVPELLAVTEVCVLSSVSEGFSNAILEYMAASKPVVATRVGGAAEVVAEGENGFLVDSDDDAAMAARMIELLENPETANRFGRRGRKIIEDRFSATSQLSKTLEIYRRLLSEKMTNERSLA